MGVEVGLGDLYDEGNSEEDWIKKIFNISSLPQYVSYEEFKKKGYFVVPCKLPDQKRTVANRWYYEGRPCDTPNSLNPKKGTDKAHELATYSGKIEFVSQSLTKFDPNDEERPPLPRYIPSWEGQLGGARNKGAHGKVPSADDYTPPKTFLPHTS
jgi:trimethylamine-N-oxide reductase (cytochrome c)